MLEFGYVGLSLAVLLSQNNDVVAYDISAEKVEKINNKKSTVGDKLIQEYLDDKKLNLKATKNYTEAFEKANFIIICTPTNYDDGKKAFDTSSIEDTINKVKECNVDATIIIKSTVPVGYTDSLRRKYRMNNIFFSPEFLREGHALYDNLYPSRIIVGGKCKEAESFANLLIEGAINKDVSIKYMDSSEAEAVKLFANSYLALRVAFFNELDTYAEIKHLNPQDIIQGVSLDSRIGDYYNNPSFGYGGYCLPKDTKQLLTDYENIPQNIIQAVVSSNQTRKKHIAQMVMGTNPKTIGIYKLTMKKNSDNYRNSAIKDIVLDLKNQGASIIVYEPLYNEKMFCGCEIINDFNEFAKKSDIILANRFEQSLQEYKSKVYTRDLYNRD